MSKNSKPNVEALRNTMAIVEEAAQHELWDQNMWITQMGYREFGGEYLPIEGKSVEWNGEHFCNTAACFAGWAVMLDGWKVRKNINGGVELHKGGRTIDDWEVEYKAKEILGLGSYEAAALFSADNTLEDLRNLVNEFCGDEEQTNA